MSDAVVEETRTEVSVEEVTETRYRCAVCEMLYDANKIITVGLDRYQEDGSGSLFDSGAKPRAERYVCRHCSDGLFEYEPQADSSFSEAHTPAGTGLLDHIAATGVILLFISVPVAMIAAAVAIVNGAALLVPAVVLAVIVGYLLGVGL